MRIPSVASSLAVLLPLVPGLRLAAQPPPARRDTVSALTAHVRAKGDTLFLTIGPVHAAAGRAPETKVVWFHDTTATMLAGPRRVPLSPVMVRVFRGLYADARACPQPAVGCDMDHRLFGAP